MSMIASLYTLSEAHLEQLLADPPLVWKVVAPDDPALYARERKAAAPGFLARLLGRGASPDTSTDGFLLGHGEVVQTDIDKAWNGIHYLLTQSAEPGNRPLDFLIADGLAVGGIEVACGPARAFHAVDVRAIDHALHDVDRAVLAARFDPAAMRRLEIYPDLIWDNEDALDYCLEYFDILKRFIGEAARRGCAMLLLIG